MPRSWFGLEHAMPREALPAARAKPARQYWSSRRWLAYFRRNARTPVFPWARGTELQPTERALLAPSLQGFQQGEGQEGTHFFHCVRADAEQSGDWDYVEAHRLFMAEEQRHAADLARFLALVGIPTLQDQSWFSRAFCWCGSRGSLELTLLVIGMSEIMGQVYYTALRSATASELLRQICTQILRDEKSHVRFQCERLALLRRQLPVSQLVVRLGLDAFLFLGAAFACWLGHRRALRAGGRGWRRFWREAVHAFGRARPLMDPRHYTWEPEAALAQPDCDETPNFHLAGGKLE
jgi:hypothetical protein